MDIEKRFEAELKRHDIYFKKTEYLRYTVKTPEGDRDISIHNLNQNYTRDNDPRLIERFVESTLQPTMGPLDWGQLKSGVYPSLEPSDYSFVNEVVYKELADTSIVILAYYNPASNQVRYISKKDLLDINVDIEIAWKQAYKNIDTIMSQTQISFTDIDGKILGMIEAQEPYKASLILSHELKGKVIDKLGWPIFAVAPARDFVYLFSKDGGLVNRVGGVVVREFKNSGYPISTDVWELSDSKQVAIGAFPVE